MGCREVPTGVEALDADLVIQRSGCGRTSEVYDCRDAGGAVFCVVLVNAAGTAGDEDCTGEIALMAE